MIYVTFLRGFLLHANKINFFFDRQGASYLVLSCAVTDWNSMGQVMTPTRDRAFQVMARRISLIKDLDVEKN